MFKDYKFKQINFEWNNMNHFIVIFLNKNNSYLNQNRL